MEADLKKRWRMYWEGFLEAQRLGLDDFDNWQPIHYHLAVLFLLTGTILGCFMGGFLGVLIALLVGKL